MSDLFSNRNLCQLSSAQTSAALSSKIDELTTERDALLKEKQQLEVASEFVESKLKDAHMDREQSLSHCELLN